MRNPAKVCLQAVALLMAAFLLTDCQLPSPSTRIEENPVMFNSLPNAQKLMVQQGHICSGMSKDAVYLAWGHPTSAPITGEKNGKHFERWVYSRSRAVYVDDFGSWHSHCPHHHHGHCHDCGVHTSVMYVPEEVASVSFENGKVVEWESRR